VAKDKKKDIDIIKSIVQATTKSIKSKTGRDSFTLDEMERKFGVPDYISTGLPHWDLYLPHNEERTAYGIPYGRITEFHGENSSFKSTMLLIGGAKNLAKGGITYSATCEMDYDSKYVKRFIEEEGLDYKKVEDNWIIQPVKTVKDMFLFMQGIVEPLKELAEQLEAKGMNPLDNLPRVAITLDSLGALIGDTNNDRLDKDWDDGDQMGSFAKEVHNLFKFFLYDIGRLGIAFMFSNHFRDNLGFGMKKNIPAHDSAVKFYASLRLEQKLGYSKPLAKSVTRDKQEYKAGVPLKIKIYKGRTDFVMSGELEVDYYYNYGFDYIGSLIIACRMTGLLSERAGTYEFSLPDNDGCFSNLLGKKYGPKELRETLKSDSELMVKLEMLAYKVGPIKLEDTR